MKTCSYCGKDNDESRSHCFECGDALLSAEISRVSEAATPVVTCLFCGTANSDGCQTCRFCANALSPAIVPSDDQFVPDPDADEISAFNLGSLNTNGFPYPDWQDIWKQVQEKCPKYDWDAAYRKIVRAWLSELRDSLGGSYRCFESQDFFLLCAEGQQASHAFLGYAENAEESIQAQIGRLAHRETYGKRVLIAFSEDDDYYTYLSCFYPEGTHTLTSGVCIYEGYIHIAWPFRNVIASQPVLLHELVHANLVHLNLPRWLDEGFAQRIEGRIAQSRHLLDNELAARHRNYWNEANIQSFWAGSAFSHPDSSELSYNLSEILVELLAVDREAFLDFASAIDWRDAGQDAAVRHLDKDLGEVLGGFLGDGDWRPSRKRISSLLNPKTDSSDTPSVSCHTRGLPAVIKSLLS